ncbi:histidine kinase [Pontibacter ummariensis]|uniref:histidine kinase n=1 Tax=Pontibacter ummariensis TaxID=1610492 RepID=A0A239IT05_9BACT|nr:histidine kinase [Pontibacter ummariensis]PRY08952.1 histidine kinase [Pontibacter ummariensis]SNS96916.1 Histidine kinase [Pontibacter ummariensis]
MFDVLLLITVGTLLLLLLVVVVAFLVLAYRRNRLLHHDEVNRLVQAYQKELLKARIEMQEQTFLSIAQEIHDNVGQVMALVRLNLSTLPYSVGSDNAIMQRVTTCKELVDQAIEDLRNLSKRLNCEYASSQSLPELLKFQLGLIHKTGVIHTQFEMQGEERGLDPEKKLIVFRIAQEALSNVMRHAEASCVKLRLIYSCEKIVLSILDNGKGFCAKAPSLIGAQTKGTGTFNMSYRAKLIGAKLRIKGRPGAGTLVFLELPIN